MVENNGADVFFYKIIVFWGVSGFLKKVYKKLMNSFFQLNREAGVNIAVTLIQSLLEKSGDKFVYQEFQTYEQISYVFPAIYYITSIYESRNDNFYDQILNILYYWYKTVYENIEKKNRDELIDNTFRILVNYVKIDCDDTKERAFCILESLIKKANFLYSQSTWLSIINSLIDILIGKKASSMRIIRLTMDSIGKSNLDSICRLSCLQNLNKAFDVCDIDAEWASIADDVIEEFFFGTDNSSNTNAFFQTLWDVSPKDVMISAIKNSLLKKTLKQEDLLIPRIPYDLILSAFAQKFFIGTSVTVSLAKAFSMIFGVYGTHSEEWLSVLSDFIQSILSNNQIEDFIALTKGFSGVFVAHPTAFRDLLLHVISTVCTEEIRIDSSFIRLITIADQLVDRNDENYGSFALNMKTIIEKNIGKMEPKGISPFIIFLSVKYNASINYVKIMKFVTNGVSSIVFSLIAHCETSLSPELVGTVVTSYFKVMTIVTPDIITSLTGIVMNYNLPETAKTSIIDYFNSSSYEAEAELKQSISFLVFCLKISPFIALNQSDIDAYIANSEEEPILIGSNNMILSFYRLNSSDLLVVFKGVFGTFAYISSGCINSDLESSVLTFLYKSGIDVVRNETNKIIVPRHMYEDKCFSKPYTYIAIAHVCNRSTSLTSYSKITTKFMRFISNIATSYSKCELQLGSDSIESDKCVPVADYANIRNIYVIMNAFQGNEKNKNTAEEFIGSKANVLIIFNESGRKINVSGIPKGHLFVVEVTETDEGFYSYEVIQNDLPLTIEVGMNYLAKGKELYRMFGALLTPISIGTSDTVYRDAIRKRNECINLILSQESKPLIDNFISKLH